MFVLEGTLGVLWFVVWVFVVFDDPESHPRISLDEKEYIKSGTKSDGEKKASACIHSLKLH